MCPLLSQLKETFGKQLLKYSLYSAALISIYLLANFVQWSRFKKQAYRSVLSLLRFLSGGLTLKGCG